jgi:GTPase
MIDQARISVRGGDGGKGCRCFYRDKYTCRAGGGIPDGGDGGKGADVVLLADRSVSTLLDFKYKRVFIADNGNHGSGKNKKGKSALPLVLTVPVGTIVKEDVTGYVLRDLNVHGASVTVVKGGDGGLGNMHKTERYLDPKPGEKRDLILELKLIADVGIVGVPNAGKSTFITKVTHAHSKIANYPFTTLDPILGVVQGKESTFTLADIPGLIEGSHNGKGLGDKFLRHIERTKILLLVLDMAGGEDKTALDDYKILNKELSSYSKELAKKEQFVVANKMDLPEAKKNLILFKKKIKKKVFAVSALNGDGLEEVIDAIEKRLQKNSR